MAVPPALIGAIAKNTGMFKVRSAEIATNRLDWRLTDYEPYGNGTKVKEIPDDQTSMVVPLVFQYLTPKWVSFIGKRLRCKTSSQSTEMFKVSELYQQQ